MPAGCSLSQPVYVCPIRCGARAVGRSSDTDQTEDYLRRAGGIEITRTHGRREVAFLNRAWEDVLAMDLCLDTNRQAQPLLDHAVNTRLGRCAGFEGLGTGWERITASL